jgi:hypothetical protein
VQWERFATRVNRPVGLVVDCQVEIERSELVAVATVGQQRLDRRDDDGRANHFSSPAGCFVDYRLELREDDIEVLHCLLRELDSVNDKKDPLGVPRGKEAPDEGGAKQGLARAGCHLEQEFSAASLVVTLGDLIQCPDLIAA